MSWIDAFRIKEFPEDFHVSEVLAPQTRQNTPNDKSFDHFKLLKSGYTTFEAIDLISNYFDIDKKYITYCGLKDEDGITEQWISIESYLLNAGNLSSNETFTIDSGGKGFISLYFGGRFNESLRIGELEGNIFKIGIRSVDASKFGTLDFSRKQHSVSAINYYDTQRFGVPNAPKTTHIIGGLLLQKNYAEAFELLRKAQTPESKKAIDWQLGAKEFFDTLDKRVLAFFMSAYSSFQWNDAVNKHIRENIDADQFKSYEVDGLEYIAISSQKSLFKAFADLPSVEYHRYRSTGESFTFDVVERPTFIQIRPRIISVTSDEANTPYSKIETSFFLPPGSYATNIIRQWLLPHLS